MAITQSRMLSLLKIADSFKNQILAQNAQMSAAIRELPPSPTLDQTLECIQTIQAINSSLTLSPFALETLAAERAHFKANATKNLRQAERARQRRGGTKLSADQTTAPASIGQKLPENLENFFLKNPKLSAPLRSAPAELSIEEMAQKGWLSKLASDKFKCDAARASVKMAPLYPDITNDEEPLSLDDQISLGYVSPDSITDGIF